VVERYAYSPYGKVTVLDANFIPAIVSGDYDCDGDVDGADFLAWQRGDVIRLCSAIDNELLYTGRRRDPETGLQLNRNRFYHSGLGRWVNRDPIGYEGGTLNLYEYVGGMPTIGLDPQGEFIVIGGIIAAWLIWQAACAKYATSAAEDAFTNDKEKHCMAACLHNKCTGFFQPGATLGGAIGWEWLGGWSEGNNDSEQDIGAGAAGIVHSYFGDCKDSCEGCDAQFPVSPRPPNQGGGGWDRPTGGGGF